METKDTEKIKDLEARVVKAEESAKKANEAAEKAERERATALAAFGGGTGAPITGAANSDEKRALSFFGCRHVKDLLSVNTGSERFKHVPAELKHLVRQLKNDLDVSRMIQQRFHGEGRDDGDIPAKVKGVMDGNYFGRHVLAPKLKAFGTGVTGAGEEWVPEIVATQYIEEFELDRQVMQQFRQVNMPSSPFRVPVQTDVTTARRQVESCDPADNVAAANFGTTEITLEAEKLVEYMCLPEELNEDSAPDILSLVRAEVSEAQARAWETGILNGDDSGTHMDSDVTGVVDARTAWKGLRRLAVDNSALVDFGGVAGTITEFRAMRALMAKFGVNERNLVWVVSTKVYNQMLSLEQVTTVEKFGPMATILRGALAALDGIPIVISEFVREDLNANAVYDGITTDKATCYLVNRSRFMWGVRRAIRVRVTQDPTPPGDRWLMASWWRGDFQGHAQSASETSVVCGRNIGG